MQRLDLFFLIDGSGSIGSSDFDTSLDFVAQAASTFTIASDRVRTGLAIYDHSITFRSFLNRHTSIATFTSVALNSPYPGGKDLCYSVKLNKDKIQSCILFLIVKAEIRYNITWNIIDNLW